MSLPFTPRPSQRRILRYTGGRLGVAAVPGSGKTHTLSALAAQILASGQLEPQQEVLIVTLVNSAVDNFSGRIAEFVNERGLLPHVGYRVRTLHGLAHDIVREDPPLVGLEQQFSIVDEIAASSMVRDAARAWVHAHADYQPAYVLDALDDYRRRKVGQKQWPELVEELASSFIRSAKDRRWTPDRLRLAAGQQPSSLPLLDMGIEIYADYQRALTYRGAVDFDDLIRLAATLLETSPELLERLRFRWPFILEDEAQDSSENQQHILSALAGKPGNWVRVGDPNQAIFETFTTADPDLLRTFIEENPHDEMPESGRCQPSIFGLANFLIEWAMTRHPILEVRDALTPPPMKPAPAGDPQPNPPDDSAGVILLTENFTPEEEVDEVARSLHDWMPKHADETVAILAATNDHAARMTDALRRRKIKFRELLRSTSPTRAVAGALSYILNYLGEPDSASKLAQAYKVWRRDWREDAERQPLFIRAVHVISKLKRVEDYLAPISASLPLAAPSDLTALTPEAPDMLSDSEREALEVELDAFRAVVRLWHGATVLPVDQLILTVAPAVFSAAADLALAHKLALVMRQLAGENPHWRLPELTPNLAEIARNERRFIGFSADDSGFDPQQHKGVVVVSTMHKAKGLEWDRVYLTSVNDYDYPSGQPGDHFMSEKWFVRDGLNLEAEALGQLKAAAAVDEFSYYQEGEPTRAARLNYVRERLRLLYVGITRARRELVVSWNTGRRGDAGPALALKGMQEWRDTTNR